MLKSIAVVKECQTQLEGKDYRARKTHIMGKIESCCTGKRDESGYLIFNWVVGKATNDTRVEGVNHYYFTVFIVLIAVFMFRNMQESFLECIQHFFSNSEQILIRIEERYRGIRSFRI